MLRLCRAALSKQLSSSSLQQTSLLGSEAWQLIWSSSAVSTDRPAWHPQDNIELGEHAACRRSGLLCTVHKSCHAAALAARLTNAADAVNTSDGIDWSSLCTIAQSLPQIIHACSTCAQVCCWEQGRLRVFIKEGECHTPGVLGLTCPSALELVLPALAVATLTPALSRWRSLEEILASSELAVLHSHHTAPI